MVKQNFDVTVEKDDNVFNIKIESKSFLNNFHALCLNDSGIFSDNYFNMLPGEVRRIQFMPLGNFNDLPNTEPQIEFNSIYGLCN